MKLSILAHRHSERFETLIQDFPFWRALRNFSYSGENWPIKNTETDLYISSVNMQSFAHDDISKNISGHKRIFLDLGMSPSSVELAINTSRKILARRKSVKVGFMQVQSILIKSRDAYTELFPGENYIPVSLVGNGMSDLRRELTTLKDSYPKAIPCVLFIGEKDQRQLGNILIEFWNDFSELIFWSESTLFGVDVSLIAGDILPLRQEEEMRYIALQSVTIREGRSVGSRGIGQTKPGEIYYIKEVYRSTLPVFAKLKDGTYVIFEEQYFQKETDTI